MAKKKEEIRDPAIRVVLMPKDTNEHGTIFGGIILSHIDLAGAIEARKQAFHKYVTVAMDHVDFKAPVYVGDIISFYTQTVKKGTTSIRVRVDVECERRDGSGQGIPVTSAEVVFVAVDPNGKPTPLLSEPSPQRQDQMHPRAGG